MSKKKRNFLKWLKGGTRIVGMDSISFEEKWRIRISRIQFFSVVFMILFLGFTVSYLLFSYTPFGMLLPENVSDKSRDLIVEAHEQVNQIEEKLVQQNNYIKNLQNVILGNISVDSIFLNQSGSTVTEDIQIDTTRLPAEIMLEQGISERTKEVVKTQRRLLKELFLMDPIVGEISQTFHPTRHTGVDVVGAKNDMVLACLEGVIIHASYDELDGWVIIIKHPNEILSIYKHCSKVLKETGTFVKAGDPIAIIGNSGSRSTGPHLHFELWSNNGPLNPMDYLSFGK